MAGAIVQVRHAVAEDYQAYARLMPALGVDDPLPSRARFVDELATRTVVATEGDAVVGYALFETLAEVGYVRNVVADPQQRRRGIGAALMAALRQRFVAAGARTWCLNVKPDNHPAIALYRRCGLEVVYHSSLLRLPSEAPLAPPADDLEVAPVLPEDDAPIEGAMSLLRGQLASARAKAGRQLVQLRRGGAIAGIAVFSPSIPGAFPFRLTAPADGPTLIAHLRTLVPAGARYLQLGVEDDDPLRDRLIALGAVLHFEMLHLRGQLR